ncbi:MAG: hypothetical protein IKS48_12980 [Eubacterium sp.]|nr:hypothetical protein [Eubacterium sp.]
MPIYYLVRLIIATIKQINVNTRSRDNIFYIIASAILWIGCGFGLFIFMIFTSGM